MSKLLVVAGSGLGRKIVRDFFLFLRVTVRGVFSRLQECLLRNMQRFRMTVSLVLHLLAMLVASMDTRVVHPLLLRVVAVNVPPADESQFQEPPALIGTASLEEPLPLLSPAEQMPAESSTGGAASSSAGPDVGAAPDAIDTPAPTAIYMIASCCHGSKLQHYRNRRFEAFCKIPGHGVCKNTRTNCGPTASRLLFNPGQGRYGVALVAWLEGGAGLTKKEHNEYDPSFPQRRSVRDRMKIEIAGRDILKCERKRMDHEVDSEPEVIDLQSKV